MLADPLSGRRRPSRSRTPGLGFELDEEASSGNRERTVRSYDPHQHFCPPLVDDSGAEDTRS